MLDGRKMRLIEAKLQYPTATNTELAKMAGVSRQSVWQWLTKDAEVKAELDRRLRAINQSADLHLRSQTDKLMAAMLDLALDSNTEVRTRNSAMQYLLDRSMGKATEQVSIDLQESTDTADVLQSFKDFLEKNGYPKFESKGGENDG